MDAAADVARALDVMPPTASDPDSACAMPSAVCALEATLDWLRMSPVPTPSARELTEPSLVPAEDAAVPLP
jgi:hypothetical protein